MDSSQAEATPDLSGFEECSAHMAGKSIQRVCAGRWRNAQIGGYAYRVMKNVLGLMNWIFKCSDREDLTSGCGCKDVRRSSGDTAHKKLPFYWKCDGATNSATERAGFLMFAGFLWGKS